MIKLICCVWRQLTFLTDNTGLAKLLRAANVHSGQLAQALQKAGATSRELEVMSFQSKLELVTDLIARIDVTRISPDYCTRFHPYAQALRRALRSAKTDDEGFPGGQRIGNPGCRYWPGKPRPSCSAGR